MRTFRIFSTPHGVLFFLGRSVFAARLIEGKKRGVPAGALSSFDRVIAAGLHCLGGTLHRALGHQAEDGTILGRLAGDDQRPAGERRTGQGQHMTSNIMFFIIDLSP